MKPKVTMLAVICLLAAFTINCGSAGSSQPANQPTPTSNADLTGMWEIHAISTLTAGTGAIIGVNFNNSPSGSNQYSDAAMGVFSYTPELITPGGTCGEGQGSLTASTNGNTVNFTLTGTQNITGSGTLSDGIISGSYEGCGDSGTFTATQSAPFTGTYSGWLAVPGETTAWGYVVATFISNESSTGNFNSNLDVDATISDSVDNGDFTCGGDQYGELFTCGGIFNGESVTAQGWLDLKGLLVPAGDFVVLSFGSEGEQPLEGTLGPGSNSQASRAGISKDVVRGSLGKVTMRPAR